MALSIEPQLCLDVNTDQRFNISLERNDTKILI